jgi:hypothetical protein
MLTAIPIAKAAIVLLTTNWKYLAELIALSKLNYYTNNRNNASSYKQKPAIYYLIYINKQKAAQRYPISAGGKVGHPKVL